MLYSIEAVTGTDEENNIVFEGRIEGITKEDVSNIEELRVGKYTSVGFGRCSICLGDEDGGDKISSEETTVEEKENITQKMQLFSEKYKKNNKIANNNNYFAVKLVADANWILKAGRRET